MVVRPMPRNCQGPCTGRPVSQATVFFSPVGVHIHSLLPMKGGHPLFFEVRVGVRVRTGVGFQKSGPASHLRPNTDPLPPVDGNPGALRQRRAADQTTGVPVAVLQEATEPWQDVGQARASRPWPPCV